MSRPSDDLYTASRGTGSTLEFFRYSKALVVDQRAWSVTTALFRGAGSEARDWVVGPRMAARKGLEPLTFALGKRCSILLSYRAASRGPGCIAQVFGRANPGG